MISPKTRSLLVQLRDETKHLEELLACNQDHSGSLRRVKEYAELVDLSVERDHPVASPPPGVFDLRKQLGRVPTVAEYNATRGR
jgi:DNA polymerase/3'-5' exonuclease PolX